MKKVHSWNDKEYVALNTMYTFTNGATLLHTKKDNIKDYVVDAVFMAGGYFDWELDVPQGTAHFLEHILTCPNRLFEDDDAEDKFKFGTRDFPPVFSNASTWDKYVSYYSWGHPDGYLRILELIHSRLDYPRERIAEFIERERGIITTELNERYKPEELDSSLAYNRFMFVDKNKGFAERRIGTTETIQQISESDLNKMLDQLYVSNNFILAIQSPSDLRKDELAWIEKIMSSVASDKSKPVITGTPSKSNTFKVQHFHDEQSQGMFMSLNFYDEINHDYEFRNFIPKLFSLRIMQFLISKKLRDELGLIYGVSQFNSYVTWLDYLKGLKLSFGFKDMEEVLVNIEDIMFTKTVEYLRSEDGELWLEDSISNYIFDRTTKYDGDYSQNIAMDILADTRKYGSNWDDVVEFTKTLTIEDIVRNVEWFLSQKPHVWMVSPYESDSVLNVFESSTLHTRFSTLD